MMCTVLILGQQHTTAFVNGVIPHRGTNAVLPDSFFHGRAIGVHPRHLIVDHLTVFLFDVTGPIDGFHVFLKVHGGTSNGIIRSI